MVKPVAQGGGRAPYDVLVTVGRMLETSKQVEETLAPREGFPLDKAAVRVTNKEGLVSVGGRTSGGGGW